MVNGTRLSPGEALRSYREKLGLTVREVEAASAKLAQKYDNPDFSISISRLSDIETKGVVPSIFKIYSLAAIYRRDPREIHKLYGVDFEKVALDSEIAAVTKTHMATSVNAISSFEMPLKLDPGFDPHTTFNVGRMIETWGVVPLTQLSKFTARRFSYGYIGLADLTMYPLLLPGSFVQIDEQVNKVATGNWRSENERPIYFIETREEYVCSWCEENNGVLTLRPHPLSPARTRSFRLGSEAEVLGQVVGVAMRLGAIADNEAEG